MTDQRTPHDQLVDLADEIYRLSGLADDAAEEAYERGELDGLLEFYGILLDAAKGMAYLADVAGKLAILKVPDRYGEYPVPNGGVFKIGGGRERKRYDNPALVSLFARCLQKKLGITKVVLDGGEIADPDATVHELATTMAAATGAAAPSFSGWRSGVAKSLGIKLNDYAEVEETPLKPRIEGRSV